MTSPAKSIGVGVGRVLAGLAGRGILASRTPWMHEREGQAQGLMLAYALFDFNDRQWSDDDLPRLLDACQRIGFAGINVTYPFKQAIIPLLDELSDGARAIGAVNTVAFRDGRRIGYNTDVTGFADGFRAGLGQTAPGTVLQLGCGGAGSATAHALLGPLGAERVLLSDTDPVRAVALHAQLVAAYGADRVELCSDPAVGAVQANGLLNATPMGMAKFPGMPLVATAIEPRHWVGDIVYFPLVTEFLAEARRKGCRVVDGSGMAVGQAADAFEVFTDRQPDRARMAESFVAFVAERSRVAA